MRIGLIGDVHAEEDRLAIALEEFGRMDLDMLLAVGDYLNGPGNISEVVKLLQAHKVICVKGNHDTDLPTERKEFESWQRREIEHAVIYKKLLAENHHSAVLYAPIEYEVSTPHYEGVGDEEFPFIKTRTHWSEFDDNSREFIESLPTNLELDSPEGKILLCHGMGESVNEWVHPKTLAKPEEDQYYESRFELQKILREQRYTFVISGHTHIANLNRHRGVIFVNAGQLGGKATGCYCVFDTKQLELEVYRFQKPKRPTTPWPYVMRLKD